MIKPNTPSLRTGMDRGELHSDSNIAIRNAALRVGIIGLSARVRSLHFWWALVLCNCSPVTDSESIEM